MSVRSLRLAVAEDQPLYREMLVSLLGSVPGMAVVASASGAGEAAASFEARALDVALLDVNLGDGDGIALGRRLRAVNPRLGVVLLSATDAMDALLTVPPGELRGWSYLSKTSSLSAPALLSALAATAAGRTVLDPALVARRAPRRDTALDRLSERQAEVLRLLAEGLSNAGVADRLGLSRRSVDNHVNAIYGALGLRSDGAHNPRVAAVLRFLEESR